MRHLLFIVPLLCAGCDTEGGDPGINVAVQPVPEEGEAGPFQPVVEPIVEPAPPSMTEALAETLSRAAVMEEGWVPTLRHAEPVYFITVALAWAPVPGADTYTVFADGEILLSEPVGGDFHTVVLDYQHPRPTGGTLPTDAEVVASAVPQLSVSVNGGTPVPVSFGE